ncbi:hypothetical protein S7711_08769 [Stachybotrys chartarum IBT 7711]|uniref:Uncharacterized protein n=1 Tax=Stachybotrys chartarum (strain CBS 109288 / IBT 7711) TaxID=1280523 RepID=A0A084AIV2_STACB|nr:hypothetical protein S7711_08769 [Stachybotrys chartarum IBT 7711]KFA47855.1 hypothetical protein S40293_06411 [Stachybotrys chartarum IBT 40293]KFA80995.1 hypothetical protein S40288_00774 [Stachybotrys chartarum IBT 40288]
MDTNTEDPPEPTRPPGEDMPQEVPEDAGPPTDLSDLEAKLNDEIRLRRFTEGVLDSRQQELEAQEIENAQLKKKLEALQKELAETQTQLTEARNQSKTKTKQLQDAKEQIFTLQSPRKDITESEAHEGYKVLLGGIQRWVENRMGPIIEDFDAGRLRARPSPVQATRFVSLLKEPAKRCVNIDNSDEYHVMAVIMNYIWIVFFSKSFYCPLDESDSDNTLMWMEELESTMGRLPRALTSQHGFKMRRAKYLGAVSEDLASILSTIAPRSSFGELQTSIRRSIVEPAADLAHRLQLALNVYSLKWPARNAWARLEVYECMNLANDGVLLDLSGTTSTSPSRQKVSYLFDLAPGLFVERVDGSKKTTTKTVHRPRVLAFGGEADIIQCATIIRWLWDNSSGPQAHIREPFFRSSTPKSKLEPPIQTCKI